MLTIYFEKTSQVTVTCLERFDSEWRVYFQIWFRRGGSVVIVLCRILYCPCPKLYGCNTKLDPQLSSSLAFFLLSIYNHLTPFLLPHEIVCRSLSFDYPL